MALVHALTDNFSELDTLDVITTYQAGVMQSAVHRSLQKHSDRILKPYGITRMQWLIVGTVLDSGKDGTRITELAEKLNTTLPYLTTTINLLQSKKILMRVHNSKDNRSKLIIIHPTFVRECEKIERTMRESLRKTLYREINPSDFTIYMKVIRQIAQRQ